MRIKRTYRIAEEAAEKAVRIAEQNGETASTVVEAALLSYDAARDACAEKDDASDAADSAVLAEQLRKKDEQITSLLAQLEAKDAHVSSLTEAMRAATYNVPQPPEAHARGWRVGFFPRSV